LFFKEYHKNPNIVVGDYVLRFEDTANFEKNVSTYLTNNDQLIIGNFCMIAQFIMNGANHLTISSYPFSIFEMAGKKL
jgi:uncharacterized membrane protein